MPPKVQGTSLSTEQVQLLCQVVQHSESPKKESWDAIAQELNISNGNAAQQRFGRLLKALKTADPSGSPDEGATKAKKAGKRGAPSKANGKTLKKPKQAKQQEDEREDELNDDEQIPSKKFKTEIENGAPQWKSMFGGDSGAVKIEDEEAVDDDNGLGRDSEDKDGEVVD